MPLLGSLLVQAFVGLASWLSTWMTKKIAIGIAAATVIGTMIGVLLAAMRAAINGVMTFVPADGYVLMGLNMAFPPVAAGCVTAVATVWAACTLYAWQRTALSMFLRA